MKPHYFANNGSCKWQQIGQFWIFFETFCCFEGVWSENAVMFGANFFEYFWVTRQFVERVLVFGVSDGSKLFLTFELTARTDDVVS